MTAVKTAFAKYYKAERDRSDRTLADLVDILCVTDKSADDILADVLERLERHFGRYGEPGSLAPIRDAIAALPADALAALEKHHDHEHN